MQPPEGLKIFNRIRQHNDPHRIVYLPGKLLPSERNFYSYQLVNSFGSTRSNLILLSGEKEANK
jgi:hypothetical protein